MRTGVTGEDEVGAEGSLAGIIWVCVGGAGRSVG